MQVRHYPNSISHYIFPTVVWEKGYGGYTSRSLKRGDSQRRYDLVVTLAKTNNVEQHPTKPNVFIAYNKPKRNFHIQD